MTFHKVKLWLLVLDIFQFLKIILGIAIDAPWYVRNATSIFNSYISPEPSYQTHPTQSQHRRLKRKRHSANKIFCVNFFFCDLVFSFALKKFFLSIRLTKWLVILYLYIFSNAFFLMHFFWDFPCFSLKKMQILWIIMVYFIFAIRHFRIVMP